MTGLHQESHYPLGQHLSDFTMSGFPMDGMHRTDPCIAWAPYYCIWYIGIAISLYTRRFWSLSHNASWGGGAEGGCRNILTPSSGDKVLQRSFPYKTPPRVSGVIYDQRSPPTPSRAIDPMPDFSPTLKSPVTTNYPPRDTTIEKGHTYLHRFWTCANYEVVSA